MKKRKIGVDAMKCKELLVIPIKDENLKLSGSLEVYVNAKAKEEFSKPDISYWLNVFEKYAKVLGFGMKHFMV